VSPGRAAAVHPSSVRAWLFDLDGVLSRTADTHAAAWKAVFDRFLDAEGVSPPFDTAGDYLDFVDGRMRSDGVRGFLASRGLAVPDGAPDDPPGSRTVAGIAASKDAAFSRALAHDGVALFDDAVTLVRALRARGVPTAVVSASEHTRAVLDAGGIADLFDACVDGVVVRERNLAGKPAPDSYLEAARLVGVAPGAAAMVEDALVGVEAGRSGGFGLVVGVDRTAPADVRRSRGAEGRAPAAALHGHGADLLAHGADVVVTDLRELLVPDPARPGPE